MNTKVCPAQHRRNSFERLQLSPRPPGQLSTASTTTVASQRRDDASCRHADASHSSHKLARSSIAQQRKKKKQILLDSLRLTFQRFLFLSRFFLQLHTSLRFLGKFFLRFFRKTCDDRQSSGSFATLTSTKSCRRRAQSDPMCTALRACFAAQLVEKRERECVLVCVREEVREG